MKRKNLVLGHLMLSYDFSFRAGSTMNQLYLQNTKYITCGIPSLSTYLLGPTDGKCKRDVHIN